MKNIDPTNKEYFTEGNPAFWLALGMVLFSIWSIGSFQSIKDYIGALIFLIFLFPAVWCTYNFFVVFSYKKAPEDSPARLLWLQDKERQEKELSEKYDRLLAPIINPIIQITGNFLLWLFRIGLVIGGFAFLSSFSIHTLLILIVVLILLK